MQVVVRNDYVHEPGLDEGPGRHQISREEKVLGPIRADPSREPHGPARSWQEPVVRVGVSQPRALGGDYQVAAQHELETAGEGETVHRRDHRLRKQRDAIEHRTGALDEREQRICAAALRD